MSAKGLFSLLLTVLLILMESQTNADSTQKKSNVIELSSKNFERLTQAASGATTGDWLVMFHAPWCGHCKRLAPVFEEVGDELKGTINVAKVDATTSPDLGKRFDIRGYPTVLLFRKGRMHTFRGQRTTAELVRFARSGFKSVTAEAVPPPITFVSVVKHHLNMMKEDFVVLLGTKKNILLVTFSSGLLLGLLLGYCCNCCIARDSSTKKAKTS